MSASPTEISVSSLAIAQGIGTWVALTPSVKDVRNGDVNDDRFRIEVRHGELMAASLTLVCGAIGAWATKSRVPMVASIAIVVALAVAYEVTLRLDLTDLTTNTESDS